MPCLFFLFTIICVIQFIQTRRNFRMKLKADKKLFGLFCLIFGIIGLLIMAHHIVSYENILRPYMDYLVENKILTNDKSGIAFLRMFTNESNIFVDVYLILFAIGVFGSKKLYNFTHNEGLRGAITLYICVTGIIYFTVLLPFGGGTFPSEINGESTGAMWFTSVVNTWNHLITPVLFTAFWFLPVEENKIVKTKFALKNLIFPICYFIMCIILGAKDGFYPYPFLNGRQMWELLFKDKPYNSAAGALILVAVVILLSGIFFGVSCGLGAIHNKIVSKNKEAE